MTEGPSRRHLSLVKVRKEEEGERAPTPLGEQLTLFSEESSHTLVALQAEGVQESQFVEWIHFVRPRLIVDTRLSPRFDFGALNRKTAFALFQQTNATYVDLASRLTSHKSSVRTEELDLAIKSLFGLRQGLVGPILFLTDSRVTSNAVLESASRSLSTTPTRTWRHLLLQAAAPHAQSF